MESFFNINLPIEDPVIVFLIILLFFLIAPLFAKKLKLPGIIGLILSGIFLGPYGFNLVSKDIGITMFGTVGLLYLMFLAGLEINLAELSRHRKQGITFGILTFILPLLSGIILTWIILEMSFMKALLFSSIFSTHTLISYPIISRYGLTRLNIAGIAISGTIITDTAVLLILTIVASLVGGEAGWFFYMKLTGFFIILMVVMILAVPYAGKWLLRKLQGESGYQFIAVLAVVFFAGFLAKIFGIEPIIGAFFAGLALNKLIPQNSPLMNRIVFIGNNLFIPFFLLSVGMLIDISALASGPYIIIVSVVIISLAILSKFLAAYAMQLLFGYSVVERNLVFGLSTSHAAATIAVTLVGFQLGLFDKSLMNVSILLILASCIVGSVVTERASRKISILKKREEKSEIFDRPERILVPLANPMTLDFLMSFAFTIKQKDSGEPIYPLTVLQDDQDTSMKIIRFNKQLEKYKVEASSTEEEISPMFRIDVSVVDGILRAVKEKVISKIIIGWNGKLSASNFILGSLLDKLVEKANSMIMIVKIDKQLETYRTMKVFIPPDLEFEQGFNDCINTFAGFSNRLKKDIEFFCEEKTREYLSSLLKLSSRNNLRVNIMDYKGWDSFQNYAKDLSENDLLIFVNARPRSLAFKSNLENIPRVLTKKYKNHNFVLVYPETKQPVEDTLSSSLGS